MLRGVLRDTALYTIPTAVTQGIAFLMFPLLARRFAPADYGVLDLLTLVSSLVNVTVALEIAQGLGRYFADADDPDERVGLASTAFWFSVAVYGVVVAVSLMLARPISDVLLGGRDPALFRLASLWMFCAGLLYLTQTQLRWELRPAAFVTVALVVSLLTPLLILLLVFGLGGGLESVVVAQGAAAAAALALGVWFTRRNLRPRFDPQKLRRMLRFSLPLVPASVGVFATAWADRLAIQQELDLTQVGWYGAGFRVALVASLLVLGVQAALSPLVYARWRDPSTPGELAVVLRTFVAGALLLELVLSVLAEEAIRFLAGERYVEGASIVPLLVPAVFLARMLVFAPGMALRERTRILAAIMVVSGAANVVLAFTLVPLLGMSGAALAALLSSSGAFVAAMSQSQRLYPVPHRWSALVAAAAAIGGLVALDHALDPDPFGSALLIAGGVVVVVTVLLRPAEIRAALAALRPAVR